MEEISKEKVEKLQRLIELEKKLGSIRDMDILLERLLIETRKIVRADAGSIYVVEGDNLRIKYAQNDTNRKKLAPGQKLPHLSFSFPINEKSISGYVAYSKKPLKIDDAYEIPGSCPYKFNKVTDQATSYRTRSIYTLPLLMANGMLLGVMQVINAQDDNGNVIAFDEDAELYINHFAKNAEQVLQNAYLNQNMVNRMLRMAEFRDPKETYAHVERVSHFSLEIYDMYAFNKNIPANDVKKFRETLKTAAKFHDIGKIGISDLVLKKPGRFTEDERKIMQEHTCIGASLFVPCNTYLDEMARDVALHHHDWWDGTDTGYMSGRNTTSYIIGDIPERIPFVERDGIPLAARIVAVADVFDALSHGRCYKEAWEMENVFSEIENGCGKQFDPDVVDAFIKIKDRILAINSSYPDEE